MSATEEPNVLPEDVESDVWALQCLDPVDRPAALDELCQKHGGHVSEIRVLAALTNLADRSDPPELREVGPFRIIRKIGEGGMGVVYAARRKSDGELVALKVIRPGVNSQEVVSRFRREARLLKGLDHPGFARFFEFDETRVVQPDGRTVVLPYLAMEFVDGDPLPLYASRRDLSELERVELVLRTCEAVAYAHTRGVVHRDLKPGNILVLEEKGANIGIPKILDFGVARATGAGVHTMTLTDRAVLVGTLPYMSPEQVAGDLGIDARSDVYSLGVLLFELLARRLPYDVRGCQILEAARIIREQHPPHLGSVIPRWRGDLEVIIDKALEKEPRHRYADAGELADDLRRFLNDQPITARPPTMHRRAARFARRHKVYVGVVLALIVGIISTTWFALRAADARDAADRSAALADHSMWRTSLAAAAAEFAGADVVTTRRLLARIPERARDFAWRYLHSQLDQSVLTIPIHDMAETHVRFSRDGRKLELIGRQRGNTSKLGYTVFALPGGDRKHHEEHDAVTIAFLPAGRAFGRIKRNGALLLHPSEGNCQPRRIPYERSSQSLALAFAERGRTALINIGARTLLVDEQGGIRELELGRRGIPTAACEIAPDAQWAVVGDVGGVHFWNLAESGRATFIPTLPGVRTVRLRSSVTGNTLAAATEQALFIWKVDDPPRLRLAHRFEDHLDRITAVALSRDGQFVATGGRDRVIRIRSISSGALTRTLVGSQGAVKSVAFSADGSQLASVGEDRAIRLWSMDRGATGSLRHEDYVYAARFDASGTRVYTGSWDGTVRMFDAQSGLELAVLRGKGGSRVQEVAPHPVRDLLAYSGYKDDPVRVLDLEHGMEVATIECLGSNRARLLFSPDGSRLFACNDRHVHMFDTSTWRLVATHDLVTGDRALPNICSNFDGSVIAVPGSDDDVLLLDGSSLKVWQTIPVGAEVYSIAFDRDGSRLAVGSADQAIRIFNLKRPAPTPIILRGHSGNVYTVFFSPDGRQLVSGSQDRTLRFWDLTDNAEILALRKHRSYVYRSSLSRDGSKILTASGDRTAHIWDLRPFRERVQARIKHEAVTREYAEAIRIMCSDRGRAREWLAQRGNLTTREREILWQAFLARSPLFEKPR